VPQLFVTVARSLVAGNLWLHFLKGLEETNFMSVGLLQILYSIFRCSRPFRASGSHDLFKGLLHARMFGLSMMIDCAPD